VRVKVSHASLNRHESLHAAGNQRHPEGITYPIILGNDAAGTLDDGTPVVIYPMMGSDNWHGDETLDPGWHIPSEFIHGTFADYVVVPEAKCNPFVQHAVATTCVGSWHGLAHRLSGAFYEVRAPAW